jgi:uncharacterized protein (TIGR02145 family)
MKKIIILFAIVTLVSIIFATTMTVHTTSGNHDFEISEITGITFGDGVGTVTDIDGNVYQTIVIGDQEWMTENLKVTHYSNGDPIPHLPGDYEWQDTSEGAYCYYENETSNAETYGNLYNWFAVTDPRGIAPEGWHVPTDEEIMQLEMSLGMTWEEAHDEFRRGTNEGSKLAGNADLWTDGNLENDPEFGSSGFELLPGGLRSGNNSGFFYLNTDGGFWSTTESTEDNSMAWYRSLYYEETDVYRYFYFKRMGISVRCVRDVD